MYLRTTRMRNLKLRLRCLLGKHFNSRLYAGLDPETFEIVTMCPSCGKVFRGNEN